MIWQCTQIYKGKSCIITRNAKCYNGKIQSSFNLFKPNFSANFFPPQTMNSPNGQMSVKGYNRTELEPNAW